MDTDYTAEQEALRATLRRLLEERAPLSWVRARWNDPGLDGEVWQALVEIGLPGLLVPEAQGGFGGGMRDAGAVLEELGRAVSPLPFAASAIAAVSALGALGADPLLRELAGGEHIGALAVEEPDRSPRSWREPGVRAEAGRLHGTKCRVLGGTQADWLIVTARDGVHAVAADDPNVRVSPSPQIDGTRPLAQVELDGARGERLGEVAALAPAIDRLVVALCADGLGAAERALEDAVAYAKERVQFGRPIGAFQAVSHLCADMLERVELARAGLHYALFALDEEPPAEGHRAAAMAKAWCAGELPRVGADAIQIFGGVGFTWEYDAHLFYKRLLGLEQLLGGPELWLEELARIVIDDGTVGASAA